MSKLMLLTCLLAGASFSQASPIDALKKFVEEDLSLVSIEADRFCGNPQGTKDEPLRIKGSPGAGVENLIVAGLVGFGIKRVTVSKLDDDYTFRADIIQSQIEASGDLRMANMSGAASRFFYTHKRVTTIEGVITDEKALLRIRREVTTVKYQTFSPEVTMQDSAFKKFSAALEPYLKGKVDECNALMLKFIQKHLDSQLKHQEAKKILDGEAHPRPKRVRRQVHTINDYAKFVLKAYKPALLRSEPLPLPPRYENFTTNSILLPVHAQVHLTKGKLWGVSTLHLAGDVHYKALGHIMRFTVPLGVNNLKLKYEALIKIGKMQKNVTVTSKVSNLQVTFILHQSLAFRSKPVVQIVRVTKIGQIKVVYNGVGPLDWLLSRLATFFANSTRWDLVKEIEALLKTLLNKYVLPNM